MKKLFLAAFAVFTFTSINAQENVLKANLGLFFGSNQFSYERVLNEKSALEFSLTYTSLDAIFSDRGEAKVTGIGGEVKYKFYISSPNDAPRGWYAAPIVSYSSLSGDSNGSEGKVSLFSTGAVCGYQWVFGGDASGFVLDLNLGLQYINSATSGDVSELTIDGIVPRLGVAVGYAW